MKYIIILLALSFASCKKCGTCTKTMVSTAEPSLQGFPQTETLPTQEYCDEAYKNAKKNSPTTVKREIQGSTVTSVSTYDCVDKGWF